MRSSISATALSDWLLSLFVQTNASHVTNQLLRLSVAPFIYNSLVVDASKAEKLEKTGVNTW